MTARAALQRLLEEDEVLQGLGFTRVEGSNAVDTPDDQRFIIVRWEDDAPVFGSRSIRRVTIWFHDRDQDYTAIDDALSYVKGRLQSEVHIGHPTDPWVLTAATWRGDSPDLIDDGFGTQTRNTGFDVVSRYDRPNGEGG